MERIIWSLWWQGEEKAPQIVQLCLQSIRRHARKIQVIVLDQKNYSQYVALNEAITKRFEDGQISLTHLSDIIRFLLLRDYGGLWLDSTIFVSKDIPEDIFDYRLYTLRHTQPAMRPKDPASVSRGRYCSFLIGGNRGNLLFDAMCRFFAAYWEDNTAIIDYFLIDYALSICCDMLPSVVSDLSSLPICNSFWDLSDHRNDGRSQGRPDEDIFYKMSYNAPLRTESVLGEETVLAAIAREYGIQLSDIPEIGKIKMIKEAAGMLFRRFPRLWKEFGFEIAVLETMQAVPESFSMDLKLRIKERLKDAIFSWLEEQAFIRRLKSGYAAGTQGGGI